MYFVGGIQPSKGFSNYELAPFGYVWYRIPTWLRTFYCFHFSYTSLYKKWSFHDWRREAPWRCPQLLDLAEAFKHDTALLSSERCL